MRRRSLGLMALVVGVTLATAMACSSGPPKCPTVPEDSGEGFSIDYMVKREIQESVKDLLNDPGSYEEESILARPVFSEARDDGSRYYTRVEVEFRAKNAFGGVVPGYAYVKLSEDPDEGCTVIDTTLAEG